MVLGADRTGACFHALRSHDPTVAPLRAAPHLGQPLDQRVLRAPRGALLLGHLHVRAGLLSAAGRVAVVPVVAVVRRRHRRAGRGRRPLAGFKALLELLLQQRARRVCRRLGAAVAWGWCGGVWGEEV
jgi:hypothetical protein